MNYSLIGTLTEYLNSVLFTMPKQNMEEWIEDITKLKSKVTIFPSKGFIEVASGDSFRALVPITETNRQHIETVERRMRFYSVHSVIDEKIGFEYPVSYGSSVHCKAGNEYFFTMGELSVSMS